METEGVAIVPITTPVVVPLPDLVLRYALDTVEYCHTFFPDAVRQLTPGFHREVFAQVENPCNRQVGLEVFRGGAKTTILRLVMSKRIAYGVSRTIMVLSASQSHALHSVRWVRKQVEFNKVWTQFYGMEKGDKWTDEHLEIKHRILGITITLVAAGITGQTRGLNIDGYRPDLILVDDPDDEETTSTPEQRQKTQNRFFGAVVNSLTPASENPEAKIVLLQTSLDKEDLINTCHNDPSWVTCKYSIFDEEGNSRWSERYPTEEVIADKAAYMARGQILLWLREKECTVGDEETADFREHWIQYWDLLPDKMVVVVSCDPAPPPSDAQVKRGLRDKDEEVWSAVGLYQGNRYLLEQCAARDHDPEWSVNTFFAICQRWKPLKVIVETVAYQQTLKWLLEKAMQEKKQYYLIEEAKGRRKKRHRILQAYSNIASQGNFYIHPSMQEFASQFASYPNVKHDDRLDSASIALDGLMELVELDDFDDLYPDQSTEDKQSWQRQAP